MTTIIECHGLTKHYHGTPVAAAVDLRVEEGEIFGIVGANGAGKTTTVECLQGLRRADDGKLAVLGLDPWHDRRRLRSQVGSQLQESALPERLRVDEALRLFGDGTDPEPLLDRWGLADLRRRPFGALSGGQRQRLFVVLALLGDPRVVFFDELTQGLDPLARRDVWRAVREVRDQGRTVVLVTHFMDEAEALCDRVAVMVQGRVVDVGSPTDLVARHARRTTVSFTPPISLDPARVRQVAGVDQVTRSGERLVVTGGDGIVAPVCALTLDDRGNGPPDLRVTHPGLEDALVDLLGEKVAA